MADESQFKAIVVDLEQVHGGRAFDKEHSFFQRELDQALEIVWRLGERAASEKNSALHGRTSHDMEDDTLHSHDCISVFGRRGVGKTSFILSLGKLVEKGCSAGSYTAPKKVEVLTPIDPTMMEDTDTFLSLVIANILRRVECKLDGKPWPEKLNQCLTDLSGKVGVLAPASVHESLWKDILLDSENYTFEILRKARSGIGLSKSVHRFLLECTKVCNVDAFMQAIDDVDTAVQRGWPVLETLRKYLSSPYLITVLAGDSQLFEVMVSQQKLNSLDSIIKLDTIVKMPNNTGKVTISMVNHLVDQYLMKVMPPHQRIMLPIVAEEIIEASWRDQELIKVQSRRSTSGQVHAEDDFSRLFMSLSKEILHFPNSLNCSVLRPLDCFKPEVGDYLSILIPRFTRSLIQFMEMLEANKSTLDQPAMQRDLSRDLLFEQLMHVFQITLSRRGILYRDMERLWHGNHVEWFTKFCLDVRQEAPRLWSLDSNYDDVGWSQRSLLLQAVLLEGWKRCTSSGSGQNKTDYRLLNPAGPMSYIIKTCLPCWIADEQQLNADNITELKNLMRIGISNIHYETASLNLAYLLRDGEWPVRGIMYLLPPIHWARDMAESHLYAFSGNAKDDEAIVKSVDTTGQAAQVQSDSGRGNSLRFLTHGFLPWWRFLKNNQVQYDVRNEDQWSLYFPDLRAFDKIAGANARFIKRWFGFYRYQPAQGNMRHYIAPIIGFARIIDIVSAFPSPEKQATENHETGLAGNSNPDQSSLTSKLINFIQEMILVRPHEIIPSMTGKDNNGTPQSPSNGNKNKGGGQGGAGNPASSEIVDDNFAEHYSGQQEPVDNDEIIAKWVKHLMEWRNSLSQLRPDEVLPPRVMSRVFFRVLEQLKVMNSSSSYPKSSWSTGQFLEQWVCCFMNALIVEELTHRTFLLKKYEDIKLDFEVARNGPAAVHKNLQVLKAHEEIGRFSRKWLSCPVLMAVVREELRDELIKVLKPNFDEDLFVSQTSIKSRKNNATESKESTEQSVDVDVYVLLCALMHQPDVQQLGEVRDSNWLESAKSYGYPAEIHAKP